jgi:hypothetical protein
MAAGVFIPKHLTGCIQPEAVVVRGVTAGRNWQGPVSQAGARKLTFDVRAGHAEVG